MTSTPSTEFDPAATNDERISFLAGRWIPHSEMRIAVDDAGFRQGVTAVERMRTYGGVIFALDAHLDRWQHSTGELGIAGLPSIGDVQTLIEELLTRNAAQVRSEGDIGITMFATPGIAGSEVATFGLHLNRLDHARIEHRRLHGQRLVVTEVVQPDPACWPRTIKTRSRIHYYRADAIARRQHEDALGVLIDDDSSITETSIANLGIVRSGEILSPPADRVLGGITQSVIESLARELPIGWSKQPITVNLLSEAEEILMMGTDGGIWYASSVDGCLVGDGSPGQIFLQLRQQFDRLVKG